MQVEELLKPFPIKELHAFPKALMGPGAHEQLIGPEAIELGFTRSRPLLPDRSAGLSSRRWGSSRSAGGSATA